MSEQLDRAALRALLLEKKRTARDVSRKAGLGETSVKDILSGKSKRPEYRTLQAIADELDVAVGSFTSEGAAPDTDPNTRKFVPRFLPVRYRVRAGLWYEIEFAEPPTQISHPVTPDPRYSSWPQWLELVEGDSINLKIPSGHYAHVVDAIEMGYAPKNGNWVVVERRCDQGRKRERTIKQVEVSPDGTVRLRPKSTNPVWGEHTVIAIHNGSAVTRGGVKPNDGEEVEVEIVGLVIGSYNPDFEGA